MLFESPLWLCGLLPWAAVVIYLLIGRGRPAVVPFLRFWKGPVRTSHKRAWRSPPAFTLLMLMAMLLAIVAAAQPGYRAPATVVGDVTIIFDCGSTMARPGPGDKAFRGAIDNCTRELGPINGRVSIVPIPGQRIEVPGAEWAAVAKGMSPTAIAVKLDQVVADQLHQTRGLVVVLSDQPLGISDPRLVQILPEPPLPAVAITMLASRSKPKPQVMVRLENHSDLKTARVVVKSGGAMSDRQVPLPPNGRSNDYFFDMGSVNETVTAELSPHSPRDPWSHAFLARQSTGVHLSVIGEVPESVQRMADVYSKDRPAGPDAPDVFISGDALADQQPGIWVDPPASSDVAEPVTALPSAVTQNVKAWPATGKHGTAPPGFTPVVSRGIDPIVAVRESPVHQVWLRANMTDWEKTPDFVIFFGNALDWIADTSQWYSSITPTMLGSDWKGDNAMPAGEWPGICRSTTGRLLAVNAGEYPSTTQVIQSTRQIPSGKIMRISSLSPATILAALLCMLLGIFAWPSTKIRAVRYSFSTKGNKT